MASLAIWSDQEVRAIFMVSAALVIVAKASIAVRDIRRWDCAGGLRAGAAFLWLDQFCFGAANSIHFHD